MHLFFLFCSFFSEKKLVEKNLDIIVGNVIGAAGSGFETDTNQVTFFFGDGSKETFPVMGKDAVANILLDRIVEFVGR